MNDGTRLIDKREVARRCGCSVASVDRWRRRAERDTAFDFPTAAVLPSGVVRWREADIERWITERFRGAA